MKKLLFTLAILVGFATRALAYDFQSGNLLYTIISTDPPCVSVAGHVDGTNAQGELVIPETVEFEGVTYTVTRIGQSAFSGCQGLTGQLVIPNTVDSIYPSAFSNCRGFTGDLVIPNSVHCLGGGAFQWCFGFDGQLVLPDSITFIGVSTFQGCSGLSGTLTIPNTVTIIGAEAFCECSGFTGDLVIPNSVTELNLGIPDIALLGAFQDCTGFDGRLVLSENLEVIHSICSEGGCFWGCSNLAETTDGQPQRSVGGCFWGCSNLTGELVLPNTLKKIGGSAFYDCSGLTGRLVLPDAVEQIGTGAFAGCSGFTDVELHHQVFYQHNFEDEVFFRCGFTNLDIPEGWTTTGDRTFSRCDNLTSVHLPESLVKIGYGCFSRCTNLSEVNIPEGVTTIDDNAFAYCRSLTHIELPASLRTIRVCAFSRCTSLSGELVIPDSVEIVYPYTFDSCYQIQRVVLGSSVNLFAEESLRRIPLEELVVKATTPPLMEHAFWQLPRDLPVIVPCGTLEAYQNAEGWHDFTNITENCSGLPVLNGSEWYYEIQNANGSITYQHLEYAADTTVNHKDVQIIIRTNTLYDKGEHIEVTREYLYEENGKVYWWNPTLQEFTVLYDFSSLQGDEWEIKVGTATLTMHVDAVEQYEYEGRVFKMLQVSDVDDLFSGTIVCGIGHLTSFFPERLMTRGINYRVEGIRCYWREGELVFKYGDKDCDEVYQEYHNGVEEDGPSTGSGTLNVYPNPTDGVLFVQTLRATSLLAETYRISNMIGQTLMSGTITTENQQIDVSNLPKGMYFITIAGTTRKFVVR